LKELQAVDDHRKVTRLGKDIARFPVDLKLARMLLESARNGCLSEVLTIVSVMAIQDPRERPLEFQNAADEKHRQHFDEQSDFISLVNLWRFYEAERQSLTASQLRAFCRDHFLSFSRMREWKDNHRQLRLLCKEIGLRENQEPADYASIHRSLLSGLLGNIGERGDNNEYLGTRNSRHYIFPGSSQFKRKPRWIMSAELVETTRLFGRTVAAIDNEWIEPLARHLVKRNYNEPHFDPKRGQVFTFEEVMLYGLSIIKRRKTDFGAVDPVRARQIFIQHGLVEHQLQSDARFYLENRKLIKEVEELESRTRKRDILVDNYRVYRFYDDRIPAEICSEIQLANWCKQLAQSDLKLLYLSKADLMRQETSLSTALYPDTMDMANAKLKLEYHFDPEDANDGVSLKVPIAILRQVDEARLDWLIPGLLREKCLALLKSLPKSIRKNFVPAPDYVDRILDRLVYDGRPLHEVMASALFRETGVSVSADAFDHSNLDRHLKMNIKVIDDKGKVLGTGRDLSALVTEFEGAVDEEFSRRGTHEIEVASATDWVFGDLPAYVELRQSGISVRGYPALIDKGETVALEIVDNESTASRLSQDGLARLIMLNLKEQRKYIERNFPGFSRFAIYFAAPRFKAGLKKSNRDELLSDLVYAVFRYTFIEDKPPVMTQAMFRARLAEKQQLVTNANFVGHLIERILETNHRIEQLLGDRQVEVLQHAVDDIRQQLDRLLGAHFIKSTPMAWLSEYPRYLAAIEYRLEKLPGNLVRDKERTAEVNRFEERFLSLDGKGQEMAMQYRFMLEEFRVSLFAQPLGTSAPISARRLEKLWRETL
ncbi:MAG: ATP-dependent RNA helicase HrpA, partial [Pseudomonadales bacterium]